MEERKSKLTMKKQKKGRGRKKDLDLSGDMLVCQNTSWTTLQILAAAEGSRQSNNENKW